MVSRNIISNKSKNMNIKNGDFVYVIAGKEKGKKGKVLKIIRNKSMVVVEKLNMVKRHSRPSQKSPTGGIIEMEAPMHVSNLMLVDPSEGLPVRIGYRVLSSGEKVRYSRKTGEEIKG